MLPPSTTPVTTTNFKITIYKSDSNSSTSVVSRTHHIHIARDDLKIPSSSIPISDIQGVCRKGERGAIIIPSLCSYKACRECSSAPLCLFIQPESEDFRIHSWTSSGVSPTSVITGIIHGMPLNGGVSEVGICFIATVDGTTLLVECSTSDIHATTSVAGVARHGGITLHSESSSPSDRHAAAGVAGVVSSYDNCQRGKSFFPFSPLLLLSF